MGRSVLIISMISLLLALPAFAKVNEYKTVALISSSTQYDESKIDKIKKVLTEKGYKVEDKYLQQVVSDFGYVNTDKSRAKHLIEAMLDNKIDIIWFVRGGAGALNLLPDLYQVKEELAKLKKPKIIVGFSDVTAIHYFVNNVLGWPSVHGVLASYNKEMKDPEVKTISINDLQEIPSIKDIFKKNSYSNILPLNELAKNGVQGKLFGGNLTLLQSFFSTHYEAEDGLSEKILILEDVGISFRQLDRALHQLLFKKDLNVNAIIFGQFYPLQPTDEERLMYKTVIKEFANKYAKPVYYYPYIGHGRKNIPLLLNKETALSCPKQEEYCHLEQKN